MPNEIITSEEMSRRIMNDLKAATGGDAPTAEDLEMRVRVLNEMSARLFCGPADP